MKDDEAELLTQRMQDEILNAPSHIEPQPCEACAALRAERDELRVLVAEVYAQAGNAAPPDRRHALTPNIRDRMRTYLNGIGFWKSK